MADTQDLTGGRRSEGLAAWLSWVDRGSVRGFRRLAARRELCLILVGLAAFLAPAIHAYFSSVPEPKVQDEFSYLLAADTFARGRLTNPTHPHWRHFENLQIFHRPTYMSKYPPGQGLALAAGRMLFGAPIHGVWLSSAAAVVAVCWMLQVWSGPSWALVGAVVMILSLGVNDYWCQGYWGGMVAVMGRRAGDRGRASSRVETGSDCLDADGSGGRGARQHEAVRGPGSDHPGDRLAPDLVDPRAESLAREGHPAGRFSCSWRGWPAWVSIIARSQVNSLLMPYSLYDSQYDNVPAFIFQPLRAPITPELPRMREYQLDC